MQSGAQLDAASILIEPLPWLDMSAWDDEPAPERKWAIRDRVPLNQAGLFSGEGGTGKSIIELMKDVAHVTGKDWLGSLPEAGPAFYLGAEDDERRNPHPPRRHRQALRRHVQGTERWRPACALPARAGCHALRRVRQGRQGRGDALYKQLYEAAGDIKPKNISIDTLVARFRRQ